MKIKKQAKQVISYLKEQKSEDGYVNIDVRICEGELYDKLSTGKSLDLAPEIYDFIDREANIVPHSIPLNIRFHLDFAVNEDEVRKLMHRHYTIKSYDLLWDMAANFRKCIGFSIFGVAVIALYLYFALARDEAMASEILSIIGSFSLWQAADAYLLERPVIKRAPRNNRQNIEQKTEFIYENENKKELE